MNCDHDVCPECGAPRDRRQHAWTDCKRDDESEDDDPSLHYWATYPVDWDAVHNGYVPQDDDPL